MICERNVSFGCMRYLMETHLIDEERVASEALHRLEQEVLQFQSLDSRALCGNDEGQLMYLDFKDSYSRRGRCGASDRTL